MRETDLRRGETALRPRYIPMRLPSAPQRRHPLLPRLLKVEPQNGPRGALQQWATGIQGVWGVAT
jgi:hypothetical protein